MNDTEIKAYSKTGFSFFTTFILLPAYSILFIFFGYHGYVPALSITLMILGCTSFIRRFIFISKNSRFFNKKRIIFENISYIFCVVFDISTAFLVSETIINGERHLSYYFLNIYIQPIFIIFTFVLLGYMAGTAKKISSLYTKSYNEKYKSNI